jgi:hypothetical protein
MATRTGRCEEQRETEFDSAYARRPRKQEAHMLILDFVYERDFDKPTKVCIRGMSRLNQKLTNK